MMPRIATWLRAIRVQQWTKNLVIPACWFFAVSDPSQRDMAEGWRPVVLMFGMFASFCLVSSAFYLLNDVRDREADRLHPVKRTRPVAAGLVSPAAAVRTAAVLFVLGFFPSLVMFLRHTDRWPMMAVVLGYSAMQVAYSWCGLKRIPYVDVVVIAAGFVLRAMAGTTVLAVRLSPWLLVCAFSLSLFIALCKRRHEKLVCEESRTALAGYRLATLDMLVAATAMTTLAVYVAYTLVPETIARYGCGAKLAFTAVPVAMGLVRYLQLTYSRADVGRPEKVLLSDRVLWLVLFLYAATAAGVLLWRG
ncbi:MAG: UbiA prenyltransferase family protein [Kiritimatiellae bacterium]|nr:UbiA prenyltransferase family protein [Kiritimatiellia bacterium]